MVVSEFHSLNLPELPLRVVVQLLLQLPGSTRVAPAPAPAPAPSKASVWTPFIEPLSFVFNTRPTD